MVATSEVAASSAVSAVGATPAPQREVRYPASLAQQRFWVLDRLDPGNPSLNVAVRWRVEGELAVSAIEKAFQLILARHEVLRTFFIEEDGEPIQAAQASAPLHLASIDLTALPQADALVECDRIAQAEAQTPFNLAIAPLIRVTHVRVGSDVAILMVTTHHTVCDGWSIGLLAAEMGEICAALQSGRPPTVPELPVTYGEYACWQRQLIAEDGLSEDVEYWSKTLDGMGYFELPTDFRHKAGQAPVSSIRSVLLDRPLTDEFAAVARHHGCTMFMAALAALLTLLHRYTGATDVALGTQVAGRSHVEIENLVGLFINTLVLRTKLADDPEFRALLGQIREVVADALEHNTMPLEKVIETLRPKRYPGHNAVFSVNFIFQRSFVNNADYGKFRLVDLPSYSAGAMYDLNFFMVERPEGWRASCEFNAGLYEEKTIDRLLRHFVNILRAAAARPSLRISEIPIIDEAERHHLVFECNRTAASYPQHLSLPQLFDQQAARTPASIAVVAGGQALSYEQVGRRSDALAAELLRRGIGPGARVGVLVERSADLVIAPLAIMKAGSAYVPLDPVYPIGRLTQIVAQSSLAAIVAQTAVLPSPLSEMAPFIIADKIPVVDEIPGAAALPAVSADDTAYLIFTSGSTGQPKGVQIPHRALTNFLWSMQAKPGFTARDTIVAVTTICFDIAVLELFLPLTVGATTVIATDREARDGRLLLELLRRARAGVLQATPTTWRMLIEAGWHGDPPLRMLCGGEAIPRDLADQLLARNRELWNMYGPTETTIWSSAQRVTAEDAAVPIGPPIANTQFYVVDPHDEPVPQGAVGELLIGGDGVALGYWGMPGATRERFVPDKFRNLPGKRLYRTGDMVRMRRDEEWEFLGRADDQVKLRGFRIELGEIEAALLRHPQVRNAAAVAGEGAAHEPAIFAYVEPVDGEATEADQIVGELYLQLMQTLPGYMRPAAIAVIDRVPRLPNGKIDRQALPRSVPSGPLDGARSRPLNEIETRLQEIWCAVLGLETIDKSADFFDLGGHSLLAARLLARVEAVFGRRISLSALFDAPSFAGFAQLLQSSDHREFDFRQIARLQPRSTEPGIFAINNTGIYLTLSRRLGERLPVTALQLFDPSFPTGPMPASIEAIAARYVELVRHLQKNGPYAFLGWCNGGALAFEIARQLSEAGERVCQVIVIDSWVPGYLASLGWPRSKLADLSYRWKQIAADWAEVRGGQKTVRDFLAGRKLVNRLLRRRKEANPVTDAEYVAAERYDRWLVEYLDRLLRSYQPGRFGGRMTVMRSSREPAGRFLDPKLGWGGFAAAGVELVTIPGDHYSVFQEPGVSIMAQSIEAALGDALVSPEYRSAWHQYGPTLVAPDDLAWQPMPTTDANPPH